MSPPDAHFQIKRITWSDFAFRTPILLQDANGPCPLIALVNTLLLQHEFESQAPDTVNSTRLSVVATLRTEIARLGDKIQLAHLLELVGDALVGLAAGAKDITRMLNMLPQLHTGLTVNPNLISGGFAPHEDSTVLFTKIFGLKFMHGWILDADIELIKEKQYFDALVDISVAEAEADQHQHTDAVAAREWWEVNKTQMTDAGLQFLKNLLAANEFAILFRNNHFNTMFKPRSQDTLFLLLTDSSFGATKRVTWQSLTSVSGRDDIFYSGDFFPIVDDDTAMDSPEIEEADLAIIRQLQEEDDQRMARELQDNYNTPKPRADKALPPLAKEKPASRTSSDAADNKKRTKKKSICTLT